MSADAAEAVEPSDSFRLLTLKSENLSEGFESFAAQDHHELDFHRVLNNSAKSPIDLTVWPIFLDLIRFEAQTSQFRKLCVPV